MKYFVVLLSVAIITIAILIFLTNPELLEDIWLWIIGLIGNIILFFQRIGEFIVGVFEKEDKNNPNTREGIINKQSSNNNHDTGINNDTNLLFKKIKILEAKINENSEKVFTNENATITVLRFLHDDATTLGLLYMHKKFFAYTLEDTYRKEKIKHKTRIPSGLYNIGFKEADTPLTLKYREKYSWFDKHLEIKNVKNFTDIYIHIGNNHKHTSGCLLIADGINANSTSKAIVYSRLAFKRFYQRISALLNSNEKVSLRIMDEDWFEKSKFSLK